MTYTGQRLELSWDDGAAVENVRTPTAKCTTARTRSGGATNPAAAVRNLFSNKKSTATAVATTTAEPCMTDHRGVCVDAVYMATDDPTYGLMAQLLASAVRRQHNRHSNTGGGGKKKNQKVSSRVQTVERQLNATHERIFYKIWSDGLNPLAMPSADIFVGREGAGDILAI